MISKKLPTLKLKRKEKRTMLIDKNVIKILKENLRGKNVKGKWIEIKKKFK